MPHLTIIILNYNTKGLTKRAIESCLNLSYKELEVVVVDNASTDGSVQTLKEIEKKNKKVRCIYSSTNGGFAAGNNLALREIETQYVMLLNSDAYFPTGFDITQIVKQMEQDEDIAVITPLVLLGEGTIDPACHRGTLGIVNAFTYFSGLEKIVSTNFFSFPKQKNSPNILQQIFGGYHQTFKDLSTSHEVDACTAAAMFLRTEALNEIGLLDERFFMYGEDIDWCFRFRSDQWKIVYDPTQTVIHEKHSSGLKKKKLDTIEDENEHTEITKRTHHAFYDAIKLFFQKNYPQYRLFHPLLFWLIDILVLIKK